MITRPHCAPFHRRCLARCAAAILAAAWLHPAAMIAEIRTWTSSDGERTFEGDLVSYDPETGAVGVKRRDGRTLDFKQDFLSEADIAHLRSLGRVQPAAPGRFTPSDALPRPDGKPADMSKPVQVFILLGQSNMLGFGEIGGPEKPNSLEHAVQRLNLYPFLVGDDGTWTVRNDVRNVRVMVGRGGGMGVHNNDWLTIGRNRIGPEIGIGHHLGHLLDAPVLLLKSCIGNRSLGWDLLPPGSERFEFEGKTYAGYKDPDASWDKGTEPKPGGWYAGKQYDDDIANAKKVLDDLNTYYPGARRYEVAGFFWWQGDKDRYSAAHSSRYEQNLVRLIEQLRIDFDAPNAKFVCATLGQTRKGAGGNEGQLLDAKLAVDGESGKYPQFKGNVATVYANPLSQGGASNSHYGNNARTYMDVGLGMGEAMVRLLVGD